MRGSRIVGCVWVFFLLAVFPFVQAEAGDDIATVPVEAGFYEIEPIAFSFQGEETTVSYESSRARIFYSFHPADRFSAWKPLFVFFNGGPGCATCSGLFSLDTAPYTLNKDKTGDAWIRRNPDSWTAMGNLLHIDAPVTGFSYNLVANVSDRSVRAAEFGAQNFNPFLDAAQVLRVVLRFLAVHPSLQSNPVVIVGESYGGVRAITMQNLIYFYEKYGDGSKIYKDEALAAEIRQHLEKVFPNETVRPFPPETIAKQFGRQVLIEPLIAGVRQDRIAGEMYEQPGSPIYKVETETGVPYTPCYEKPTPEEREDCIPFDNALGYIETAGRDYYHYGKPADWLMGLGSFAVQGLLQTKVLTRALGWAPTSIVDLAPSARKEAYRHIVNSNEDLEELRSSPAFRQLPFAQRQRVLKEIAINQNAEKVSGVTGPSSGTEISPQEPVEGKTLVDTLGKLKMWDDYFGDCSNPVIEAFYINSAIKAGYRISPISNLFGAMFLQNLALTRIFMTHAAFDLIIYAPALPGTLRSFEGIVRDVSVGDDFMLVTYKPGSLPDISTPESRVIFFPYYDQSGHAVAATQPRKILDDVRDWMLWSPDGVASH